jgi:hypothetical protein
MFYVWTSVPPVATKTIEEARAVASAHFNKTGIVVSVTEGLPFQTPPAVVAAVAMAES